MKRIIGTLLCAVMLIQMLCIGTAVSGVEGYYTHPELDGQESKTVTYLYDGVTRTDYVLANSSKYKKQVFSVVEFDPTQDDLYFDVRGGGTYLNNLSRTSNTVAKFNAAEPDKRVLAATNGEFWMMNNYEVRVEGNEANFNTGVGFADPNGNAYPANVTRAYNVPHGFNMYDGEIVSSTRIEQEEPYAGMNYAFGISADGEALMGQIVCDITMRNVTKGKTATVDGINRLPADNALVMYTDKGYAKTYCLSDAYEFAFDCSYDYSVKHGVTITATLTEISEPGETRLSMKDNRIILTARGDRISEVSSYVLGDSVSFSVSVRDLMGNTDKWRTVTNCVGGRMPAIIDGVPVESMSTNNTYYPCTILGIKSDGNVVMITSYGRQYNATHGYYSYGIKISDMASLCKDLDIVTTMLCDGGGSATMVTETETGGYELTGRPCDTGYTERTVFNSVILSVGPSKSGIDSTDTAFNDNEDILFREENNSAVTALNGAVSLEATGAANPYVKYDLLGEISADEYKYAVIEGLPTETDGGTFTLGVYPTGGRVLDANIASGGKVTFEGTGLWQRKIVNMSSVPVWTGRMNFLRLDLFDDTGVGIVGEGINLGGIKLFKTVAEATAYAAEKPSFGDANGDGVLNLGDVSLIMKKTAGWNVSLKGTADYDCNGTVNLVDASKSLRAIAS